MPLLTYSKYKDKIIGVADVAGNDIKSKIGTHATVLMDRGIFDNWKQPLCYWIVRDSFKADDLKSILQEAPFKFSESGFIIQAIV